MFPCYNPPLETRVYRLDAQRSVTVIREDYLLAGSKQRGMPYFDGLPAQQGIVSVAAIHGYGQIAVGYMTQQTKRSCYIFVAKAAVSQHNPVASRLMARASGYGANYVQVTRANDQLIYYDPIDQRQKSVSTGYPGEPQNHYVSSSLLMLAAEEFARIHQLAYLKVGLDDPSYIAQLAESIQAANLDNLQPRRIWLVIGSGTILRALAQVWPQAHFLGVRVGLSMKENELKSIDHTLYDATEQWKFPQEVEPSQRPPYPALAHYDAKVWPYVRQHAQDGDFVFNVAGYA